MRISDWSSDVCSSDLKAQRTRPEIEQIMIAGPLPDEQSIDEFEKQLYLVRRRIEKKVIAAQIADFYVCSLSARSIIYKGMFLAESLADLFPDPTHKLYIRKSIVVGKTWIERCAISGGSELK